jgi:hypothetical protein
MEPNSETEVIEFQKWLDQSIRRAWILALAVSLPGAFLVTLWFPHSPQALFAVAILGIALGIISDSIEHTNRRRLKEAAQAKEAIQAAIQEATSLLDERMAAGVRSAFERMNLIAERGEIQLFLDRAILESRLEATKTLVAVNDIRHESEVMSREVRAIHVALAGLVKNLSQNPPATPVRSPESATHPSMEWLGYSGGKPVFSALIKSEALLQARELMLSKEMLPLVSDVHVYREIFSRVSRIATEMEIPLERLFAYLHFLGARSDILLTLRQESEDARSSK